MRLNVRLSDPHYPYSLPVPRVRERIVLVDDVYPETPEERTLRIMREDAENCPDKEWELPKVPYKSPEQPPCSVSVRPYDWSKRRDGVMARFKNVSNWVQPIGYIAPYEVPALPGKSLSEIDREHELTYLVKTQELELAPMWAELAANGLTAFSKDSPVVTEDGDAEVGDVPDSGGDFDSVALAIQYENGRREQFARERDYANWHTTAVRRAVFVTNEAGQRGIVPRPGSIFTKPELQELLSRKPVEKPEEGEVGEWLDSLAISEDRAEFELEDQLARYEEDRVRGFNSGQPCPETLNHRIDGSPFCQNGEVPVTIDGEVEWYEDCPTCGGNGSVLSLIGSDLPVTDSD